LACQAHAYVKHLWENTTWNRITTTNGASFEKLKNRGLQEGLNTIKLYMEMSDF